ncbi:hypothetical protein GCM10009720_14320 [Yaniella flava]|uniref:Uncharacterized protein n=1 Tax=Yaniella flava TaxID=287930 RepID=A0ABN2UDX1_9MICC
MVLSGGRHQISEMVSNDEAKLVMGEYGGLRPSACPRGKQIPGMVTPPDWGVRHRFRSFGVLAYGIGARSVEPQRLQLWSRDVSDCFSML